jgi:hypothetical protein
MFLIFFLSYQFCQSRRLHLLIPRLLKRSNIYVFLALTFLNITAIFISLLNGRIELGHMFCRSIDLGLSIFSLLVYFMSYKNDVFNFLFILPVWPVSAPSSTNSATFKKKQYICFFGSYFSQYHCYFCIAPERQNRARAYVLSQHRPQTQYF